MTLWIAILALATLGALAALWPVLRGVRDDAPTDDGERAVLRAALAENEADRAAGRIGADEAAASRAELGRRLLRLERAEGAAPARAASPLVPVATALLVPLGAFALYGATGTPEAADMPVLARAAAPVEDPRVLVERAEARLAEHPDDVLGWATLAPVYRQLGRIDDARAAYERGLPALDGADRAFALTEIAEIDVQRANGRVGTEARARLREAVSLDPANDRAGFYLALHADQSGDAATALAAWRGLIDRYGLARPAWLPVAQARVAALEDAAGPAQAAVEIANMDAGERTAMIEDMVEGLAARLAAEPGDAAGWERLVRSYVVLGRHDEALAALERGRDVLGEVAALRLADEHGLPASNPTSAIVKSEGGADG